MKKLTILFIISCICSMLNSITFLIEGNIPAFVGWFTTGLAICLLSMIVGGWNGPKARYEAEIAKYKRDLLESMARESIANKVLSNKREEITRLTRWNDPQEVLPKECKDVEVKTDKGKVSVCNMDLDERGHRFWNVSRTNYMIPDANIIGWRKIHE